MAITDIMIEEWKEKESELIRKSKPDEGFCQYFYRQYFIIRNYMIIFLQNNEMCVKQLCILAILTQL